MFPNFRSSLWLRICAFDKTPHFLQATSIISGIEAERKGDNADQAEAGICQRFQHDFQSESELFEQPGVPVLLFMFPTS